MSNQPALEQYAATIRRNTAREMAKIGFDAVLSASPVVDRSASWLLVGVGATATLLIGNLSDTSEMIGVGAVKACLIILLIAALLGVAEKAVATMVQTQAHIDQQMQAAMPALLERHNEKEQEVDSLAQNPDARPNTDVDIDFFLSQISDVVPWYYKRKFRTQIQEHMKDPLYGKKRAGRMYNRQVIYAVGELGMAIVVVMVVAWNL